MSRNNYIAFALIYGILFIFNLLFPPQADDLGFYFSAKEGSFGSNYFVWNARIGEILYVGYFAKFIESVLFDALNALMGTIFFLSSFALYHGKLPYDKQDYFMLMLLCALLLIFSCFGSTFLWGAGSFNYLWGIGLIVLFLLPFRFFWEKFYRKLALQTSYKIKDFFLGILFGVFAVLAGMASEHIGFAVCVILSLSLCFVSYLKVKIPLWYPFGYIGFLIGYLLLYLSPATQNRSALAIEEGYFISLPELLNLPFIDKLLQINTTFNHAYSISFTAFFIVFTLFYILKTNKALRIYQWIALIPFLIATIIWCKHICALLVFCIILVLMIKLAKKDKRYYGIALIFGAWVFIALILIQLGGNIPPRGKFGNNLLLFILILGMFKEFYSTNPQKTSKAIGILLVFGIAFVGFNTYQVSSKWNHLKQFIAQEKSLGKQEIIIAQKDKKQFFINPIKYFTDFHNPKNDIEHWQNRFYARYFDVKSLKIE